MDSIGFIGGGRVTRILLEGWGRAGVRPGTCVVSDGDAAVLAKLAQRFPGIVTVGPGDRTPAEQDLVFGALHPPDLKQELPQIGRCLRADAVFVSLAPVVRIPALQHGLGGFGRVARMIPNAASIVGAGFNPIAFASAVHGEAKDAVMRRLGVMGECPEVADDDLEAYAILTAMGPTYFWHQFHELERLGEAFGLESGATREALMQMLQGSVRTFFESNLTADEVIDLIPVKPLASEEPRLRNAYREKLCGLFEKLTGHVPA